MAETHLPLVPGAAPPKRSIRRILLATDLSGSSSAAADLALDLARDLGAELVIVHVVDRPERGGRGASVAMDPMTRQREGEARALTRRAGRDGIRTTFLAWDGEPGQSIVESALSEEVDLVVVGSHGRGTVGRILLGSVSQYVIANAGCPVLVAREVRPRVRQVAYAAVPAMRKPARNVRYAITGSSVVTRTPRSP